MWDMLQLVNRHLSQLFRCEANFSGLALRRLPCTKPEKHFLGRLAHSGRTASLACVDKLKHVLPRRL